MTARFSDIGKRPAVATQEVLRHAPGCRRHAARDQPGGVGRRRAPGGTGRTRAERFPYTRLLLARPAGARGSRADRIGPRGDRPQDTRTARRGPLRGAAHDDVRVAFVEESPAEWRPDRCSRSNTSGKPRHTAVVETQTPPPAVHVAVLRGAATRKLLHVHRAGHLNWPERGSDRRARAHAPQPGGIPRTVDGVTETVGRAHARLRFD